MRAGNTQRRRHREEPSRFPLGKARVRAAERRLFIHSRYVEWAERHDRRPFVQYLREVGLPKWRAFIKRDFHMS